MVPVWYLIDVRWLVLFQGLSGAYPLTVLSCGILPGRPPCLHSHACVFTDEKRVLLHDETGTLDNLDCIRR